MKPVVTRFPPSPTGYLHIGRARTALFNFLFAKHSKGAMIFRIEDTDKTRSKKEYEEDIISSLEWLGISYDSGPYLQSERTKVYKKYIQKLIDDGYAYLSSEEVEGKKSEVIRFKNPNKKVAFTDIIRGEIEFDTTDLKDFVIAKSLEEPLYHLTVVVDDHEMGVTHVIRGEDGISNTPRQILIQEGIGAVRPSYAHIPLILGKDKAKLSGRHGAVSVIEYRKKGYLPAALVNYLALLGWNPGDDREIMSLDEIIAAFDLPKVQKAGAVFDEEKLKWVNKQYMLKLSDKEYLAEARKFFGKEISDGLLQNALPVIRDRAHTFGDVAEMFKREGELGFAIEAPIYDAKKLSWKGDTAAQASLHLEKIIELLSPVKDFSAEEIKKAIWPYAEKEGKGNVLWPMRFALTGREKSPDPFLSAAILGKEESLKRLDTARTLLG